MYCKHCGKEIADDSKFCQHCGGSQEIERATPKVDSETKTETKKESKVIEIPTIQTNFSDKTKWLIFGYGIWFVLNLFWLLAGNKSGYAANFFQPFANVPRREESYYDITEFIVYVIGVPLAIWGFLMFRKKYKEKDSPLNKFIKSYGLYLTIVLITLLIGILTFVVDTFIHN